DIIAALSAELGESVKIADHYVRSGNGSGERIGGQFVRNDLAVIHNRAFDRTHGRIDRDIADDRTCGIRNAESVRKSFRKNEASAFDAERSAGAVIVKLMAFDTEIFEAVVRIA